MEDRPCTSSFEPRALTHEEEEKLRKEESANDFKIKKLESETMKNWDKFYLRNKDHFFKDRNWSVQDLTGLCTQLSFKDELVFLEAGCGVGNMLFPLCAEFDKLKVYGFDFSPKAIALLQERAQSLGIKVGTCVFDLTSSDTRKPPDWPLADLATLIFVLSAIHPTKHAQAVNSLSQFIKVGGTVIVRDYGINDHAMLRFGRGSKLGDRFYARQDGTRAFYFMRDELDLLFTNSGFRVERSEYLFRKTVNHQKGLSVDRVFVQNVYVKVR